MSRTSSSPYPGDPVTKEISTTRESTMEKKSLRGYTKKPTSKPNQQKVEPTSVPNPDIRHGAAADLIENRRKRGCLERGWMRTRLIIELAKNEKSQDQLAKQFNSTQSGISQFKKRHAAEIEEARGRLMDEFVSLWAAIKSDRIAEYMQDIQDCNALIREEIEMSEPDSELISRHMRSKHRAIRSIAEELGQIPRAMDLKLDGKQLEYIIQGVDLDKV